MPTPVSAARQCLASDSASALDAAVAAAHRRSHAQTTSLHVVFALLSSSSSTSPSLLRDALTRARSSAYSPRLQFKALDLCFSVALDRLPSSSVSEGDEPPVSNSLMAAIKRSQANQRRHPDTFHLYQQQQSAAGNTSQAFAGVRVELQQLVLAILDDPIVSRVFGEAGFRSSDIRLAILRPPPPILRFPRAARCPPLFLCNFASGEGYGFHFPAHLAADSGDENCRRIAEIIVRNDGASARNPMLVGVGAAEAAGDFGRTIERQNWTGLPLEIRGVKFVSFERELSGGDKEVICARMEELGKEKDEPGVIVSVGDLNGLMEGNEDAANCLVSELTKVLELRRGSLWVMGWSANYETYLKFLSRYPMVDKDWNLQLQPITSHRTGMGGLQAKPPSLMDSFVPFGGLFPQAFKPIGTLNNPYQSMLRCQLCNEQYEKEAAVILKSNSTSLEDPQKVVLPSWLQKADVVSTKEGIEIPKVKDDKNISNVKIVDLQKKWDEYCQHVHPRTHFLEAKNNQVIPHLVGIPYISDSATFPNTITNPSIPKTQNSIGNAFSVSVSTIPIVTAFGSQSISAPFVAEPSHRDLRPNLHEKLSISEPILAGGFQSQQAAPSELGIQDGHTSPSSVTCVTTELVLGGANNYLSLDGKSPVDSSHCYTPRNINDPSQCVSRVDFHACSPPSHNCSATNSHIHPKSLSCGKNWSGISRIEQRGLSSPNTLQEFDGTNYKAFYTSLVAKVGRQEEALWAISEAIIHCKTRKEKLHGPSLRGPIWLSFLGPDRVGKKMAAMALAELIFASKEDLICVDLAYDDDSCCQGGVFHQEGSKSCNASFRGKTIIDHIAMEINKKPLSVFLLENVDKTDLLTQNSLSNSIRTGKFSDSHGREVSIQNSIFVTTAKDLRAEALSPIKDNISFPEERILAAQRRKMKIFIEPFSESEGFCKKPISKVSVISRQETANSAGPPCTVSIRKRNLVFSDKHKYQDEYSPSIKRLHRSSGIDLDLNLSAEELDQNGDINSGSENNSTSENSEDWLEEFLYMMDKNVFFRPFDFDSLADYVLKEMSRGFCNKIGSNYMLEIDEKVMEQILAATWLMRNRSDLGGWIEQVLWKSFSELKERHMLPDCAVVRLVADQDFLMEENELGMFLPSKIILE